MKDRLKTLLAWVSQLLHTLWTFFPSLLFIFLALDAFWTQSAGKDIIVAFAEKRHLGGVSRIVFFMAIAFWVYVTWYSSRMIVYIKERWPQDAVGLAILDAYPRAAGNACFLVLELAVLQSPLFEKPISGGTATIVFFLGLVLLFFIDRRIRNRWAQTSAFPRVFWAVLIIFLVLLAVAALFFQDPDQYKFLLLGILFVLHLLFLLYSNLHRADVQQKMISHMQGDAGPKSIWSGVLDYFCIPRAEGSYFSWFNVVGGMGIVFYFLSIVSFGFAQGTGPFPFLFLAFGVLLGLANLITGFSVRYRVNFHFLLFLAAFFCGLGETHNVRMIQLKDGVVNGYKTRPTLDAYLRAWLNARVPLSDSSQTPYDVYFVLSNGGASRSGYWTASILGRLEDSTIAWRGPYGRFSDHVFCLSGTSGGGVGVATFFSMLQDRRRLDAGSYTRGAREFLQQDYFTYTVARMLGPDYLNYLTHFSSTGDRGRALEEGLEWSSKEMDSTNFAVPFYAPFSGFRALDDSRRVALPLLFVNTTRMQDGNPGVVTNLNLDSANFNRRVDVLSLVDSDKDISLASGAILGARFPYLSPAGNIADNYFVDGGYFDNSGAGVVQELMQGILDDVRRDSLNGGTMHRQLRRLHFRVLHIVNSPVGPAPKQFPPVRPIKNDLFSPLITIIGAYDMQTTVNDMRLYHFVKDLSAQGIVSDYHQVSLYQEVSEWPIDKARNLRVDTEAVYPMNWFMSEKTRTRMDMRLETERSLKSLLKEIRPK
ncbi:MAG TPA: patatin-like phospholipase family protein [Puia sp.]|jgi:hypothetical protein|nr:patatin-like phospholipase family protein [Puia sp.]